MNEIATPCAQHRRLCADGRRAREGLRPRQVHRRFFGAGQLAGRIYRSPYAHAEILDVDVSEALKLPGRDGDRHRRRLRQDLRRAADRAQRASAGARQGALQRRAGGGRGRHRRGRRAEAPSAGSSLRCASCPPISPRRTALAPAPRSCTTRSPATSSATSCSSSASSRAGLRRSRSGARRHLQLRRGLPEPDGDARRGRRLRRRARPHDRACLHPGALLRAPDAGADPRHGHVADPRGQAACRRRLRLPHRVASTSS